MDNQTKIILGLLILIAILVGIFALKITGVIKPTPENEVIKETSTNKVVEEQSINKIENVVNEQESNSYKDEISIIDYGSENDTDDGMSMNSSFSIRRILEWYISFTTKYKIVVFVITIILNIGIAMLYKKIGMPMWTIVLQVVSPILSLIYIPYITLIINIFKLASAVMLFKLLDAFRIELGERKIIFIGASAVIVTILLIVSKFNIIYTALIMLELLIVALIVMFHIKMCLNLAETFNKGKGFKFGLIFLPTIFQAILGYQKD